MRAFEVSVNGEKVCLAGIGDDGVLTTIVHCAARQGGVGVFLQVGGLISQTKEHVNWINEKPLSVGDNLQVKIVETDAADNPIEKYRLDPTC
jgi:protein tyrosine phosphatase